MPEPAAADPSPRSCPACGSLSAEPYCGQCGETMRTPQPTLAELLQGALGGLTSTDHALGRTLKGLTFDPGNFASSWVAGDRKRFLSPVRTLVWGVALFFLVHKLLGVEVMNAMGMTMSTTGEGSGEFAAEVRRLAQAWLQPILLLTLPVLAAMHWMLFRRSGRSFVDCLVLVAFVEGFLFFLRAILGPLLSPWPGAHGLMRIALILVWGVRSAKDFFRVGYGRAILLVFLARLLHMALTVLLIGAVLLPLALRNQASP